MSDEEYAACESNVPAFARHCGLSDTDPEFTERFNHFALREVADSGDLDGRTRMLAILAALAGSQGTDEFGALLPAALETGVRPVEVKELLYQAVAYLGIGRVLPFLRVVNDASLPGGGLSFPWKGSWGRPWRTVWRRAARPRWISSARE